MERALTRRTIAAIAAVLLTFAVTACSDDGSDEPEAEDDTTQESTDDGGADCTLDEAEQLTEVTIGPDGFSATCVRSVAGEPFTFLNGEDVAHNVSSQPDAATPFEMTLGQLNATFTPTLRAGTYEIEDKLEGSTMTLIVEDAPDDGTDDEPDEAGDGT